MAGCAHHITQRGNNRQDVFFVDDDRHVYLELLADQARKYGLGIVGYCLMGNHVHIVALPQAEVSLATAEASKSYFGIAPCEIIVAGDVNGDCLVNFLDFRIMALHWLESP